jgi:PAS domain S-box-containing protein
MRDEEKTKEELIAELGELRRQVADSMALEDESRSKAECALAESERRYRAIGELIPFGVWVFNPDEGIAYLSDSFLNMVGMTFGEYQQEGWAALMSPDKVEQMVSDWKQCMKTDCFWDREYTVRGKDGNLSTILSRGVPLRDRDGRVTSWVGINLDITDRKKTLEALAERQRMLATLLSNLPGMAYRCRNDADWTMEFVSHGCLDLAEYEPSDLTENRKISWARVIHPEDRDSVWYEVQEALRENRPFRLTYRIVTASGRVKWVWEQGRGVFSEEDELVALEGFITDITERKEAEEELRRYRDRLEEMVMERTRELEEAHRALMQKEKLKTLGAISAEVAHEIRNPLMSIGGFARRLLKRYPYATEVDIILTEARRLEKILDRIRNYLKPVEMRNQECDVNGIILEALDFLAPELENRDITRELELKPDMPLAYADPGILTQVFVNVIRNAMNVMDKRGSLLIKTFDTDQSIQVRFENSVWDHKKISQAETPFMPFDEQAGNIAVPLCSRLLEDMGGVFSFSQEKNHMTFTISLPKAFQPGLASAPDEP